MGVAEILNIVRDFTASRCKERGLVLPDIGYDTVLLGDTSGLDSVDLATLVFELQEATGYDPFEQGFIAFRTAGELACLFLRESAGTAAAGAAVQ